MFLRKAQAGSSSTGHTWENDGDVVEVPDEVGAELIRIPFGGFTDAGGPDPFVDPEDDEEDEGPDDDPDNKVTEPGPTGVVTEPAPAAADPVAERPVKAAAKKAAPKNA